MNEGIDKQREAELVHHLEQCEQQLENAVMDSVMFLSETGRRLQAYVYLKRLILYTINEEKKAYFCMMAGQLWEQEGVFGAAAIQYREGLACTTTDSNVLYYLNNNLGYCLIKEGNFAEAKEYCNNAITIEPAKHNAHKNLELALEGLGSYLEAAKCYLVASQLCPQDTRSQNLLQDLMERHPEISTEVLVPDDGITTIISWNAPVGSGEFVH